MRRLLIPVGVIVAIFLSTAVTLAFASTRQPARPWQGSHPLDCIHWRILDNSGNGPLVRELICSAIPADQGGDSPARDSTNWRTYVVDGAALIPQGCGGSWADPCVFE